MYKTIVSLAVFLTLVGCRENRQESFLFSSGRNGNSDIYLMDTESLKVRQLTSSPLEEWGPSWINQNEISFLRQQNDKITRCKLNLKTGEESILEQPKPCILDDKNALYFGYLQLFACNSDLFLLDEKRVL